MHARTHIHTFTVYQFIFTLPQIHFSFFKFSNSLSNIFRQRSLLQVKFTAPNNKISQCLWNLSLKFEWNFASLIDHCTIQEFAMFLCTLRKIKCIAISNVKHLPKGDTQEPHIRCQVKMMRIP